LGGLCLLAAQQGPKAVSPASEAGRARVAQQCPTFSWTAIDWAVGYRLEVFEAGEVPVMTYINQAALSFPVLTKVMQEQKDTIERLEARIDDLEEKTALAAQEPSDEELKAKYAKILGEYKMSFEDQTALLKIHIEKGALRATPPDGDTLTLEHVEGTEYEFQGEDEYGGTIEVKFGKDDQGEYTICVVVIKDLDMEMKGKKIKQG
jgi:hypothetical protein